MRQVSLAILLLLFACLSGTANATTLNVSDGQLRGAWNVDVEGVLWDVLLTDGSCIDLFSGCDSNSDLPIMTEVEGLALATALDQQVFIDGPEGNFDSIPDLTSDCGPATVCEVYIPYATNGTTVNVTRFENRAPPLSDDVQGGRLLLTVSTPLTDESSNYAYTYAVFSLVPEPSAGLLLALGLAGLAAVRRRSYQSR